MPSLLCETCLYDTVFLLQNKLQDWWLNWSIKVCWMLYEVQCPAYNVGTLVDMSDAVVWLMEYLQDEAKDREEDGRCGREGAGLTGCE